MRHSEQQLRRWETYRERHPDRAAVIEDVQARLTAGSLTPDECPLHGPMSPRYEWPTGGHVGWVCYPCNRGVGHAG